MERVTFPDHAVQQKLGQLAPVMLDIDEPANAELRQRYGDTAVPSFAMIDQGGNVLHQWVGGGDAERFVTEVDRGLQNAADPARAADNALFGRMLAALTSGDEAAIERCFGDLQALHPEAAEPRETLWTCCERASESHDWPALRAAAARYLAMPDGAHKDKAGVLADVAEFETSGKVGPSLQQRIDALIGVLDQPFPGAALGERIRAVLGDRRKVTEAEAHAWVDRANATTAALRRIGAAAVPSLLQAMRTRPTAAQQCAGVLASLRLPTTTDRLRAELAAGRLSVWARSAFVMCIGEHKEARCLPVLLEFAAPSQPTNVRTAAMWGMRDLAAQLDGTERQDFADTIAAAFDCNHDGLRLAALQAAFYAHAPLPLDALDELLDDGRGAFADSSLGDNALWILLDQLGKKLVDADGKAVEAKASAEVRGCVRDWLREHGGRLAWSAADRCYRVAD